MVNTVREYDRWLWTERLWRIVRWAVLISILVFTARFVADKLKAFDIVTNTTTATVVSADLTTQLEGSGGGTFYVGHGSLESVEYYVTYERIEDGGLLFAKYPCDDTVIYTSLAAGSTAYVEKDLNEYGSVLAYRLYVPEGSVVQEYDLSLRN